MLPGLWIANGDDAFALKALLDYFAGGHVATIARDGYEDHLPVSACPNEVILEKVTEAVADGTLWVTNPPQAAWKEPVPAGNTEPKRRVSSRT